MFILSLRSWQTAHISVIEAGVLREGPLMLLEVNYLLFTFDVTVIDVART